MTVHDVRWGERRRALRVVIADDAALVRDGVAALLRDHGVEVAATAGRRRRAARGGRSASTGCRADRHPDAADLHR